MTPEEKVSLLKEAGVWDVIGYPTCIDKLFDLVAAHAKQEYIDSVYDLHRETMMTGKDLGMLVDAVKAEREACAKVCDEGTGEAVQKTTLEILLNERKRIAKAIRDRGDE